jgi:predicted RNA-binding Zn ribbon-like protein
MMENMSAPHPKAAPGELDLIRQFVNTRDVEDGSDELAGPDELRAWLSERGLLDADERVTAPDLPRATGVREALRRLLLANNGAPLDSDAVDGLNAVAATAELRARFDERGAGTLAPVRPGIDGALARLLAIALRSMGDGTWARLKACPDHTCEAAFYDWSRNRSGTWCKMSVCGNRTKARNYRRRHAASG